jgi:hypothetical protein
MSEPETDIEAPSSDAGDEPMDWKRRQALLAGGALALATLPTGPAAAQTSSKRAATSGTGAARPLNLNVTEAPYNAAGDGKRDDRAAIQAAIDAVAGAGGGCVYFPAGTYIVGAEPSGPGGLQLKSRVTLQGEAPRASVLKLRDGANKNVIYGPANVDALWGSDSEAGLDYWSLVNIEIDGNRASNRAGNGVWIYGYKPFVENLFIGNVAEHAWHTEWGTGGPKFGMEGIINSVHIDACGKHGFWFGGPHDSVLTNVFVIDASQAARNAFDSFHVDRSAGSRFVTCHGWTRWNAARPRYALYDRSGANEFIGCHFEGAYSANVYAAGQGSTFDACKFFAAANGRNVVIKATEIVMKARLGHPLDGAPASIGVTLGESTKDWVAACDIDVFVVAQAGGAVDFTHSSGDNSVRVRGFLQSGVPYIGKPKPSDEVDFVCSGPSGIVFRQTRGGAR